MIESSFIVPNRSGLHARTAAKLVSTTTEFECQIEIGNDRELVDAKSILKIMLLAAAQGSELKLILNGPDEQEALKAILELVDNHFGEE